MTPGKEKNVTDQEEFDPATDPLSPLIAYALGPMALRRRRDKPAADAAAKSPADAERLAQAERDDMQRLVDYIEADLAAHERDSQSAAAGESAVPWSSADTLNGKSSSNDTEQGGKQAMQSFNQLLDRQGVIEQSQEVVWKTRYCIQRELGRGAQGIVYLAESTDEFGGEKSIQALKMFSPSFYETAEDYREDMSRLMRVSSRIHATHHDNLVGIDRFIERDGIFMMVMPLVHGWDLRRLLDPRLIKLLEEKVHPDRWAHLKKVVFGKTVSGRPCLQPAIAVNIIAKCLRALAELHAQGIVHGDIKPSNIMVDIYGSVRLVDIGSAFEFADPPKHRSWTPRYAPPEVIQKKPCTPQSDLASLGYVLAELLTGQPLEGELCAADQLTRTVDDVRDQSLLEEKLDLPNQLFSRLPVDPRQSELLVNFCMQIIHPDPARRFASAKIALFGPVGTHVFRDELTRGRLSVPEVEEMQNWLKDIASLPAESWQ